MQPFAVNEMELSKFAPCIGSVGVGSSGMKGSGLGKMCDDLGSLELDDN